MKLRFVCAQPATLYYAWQVEVMINNFIKNGINPNYVDIVCWKPDGVISKDWSNLAEKYPARFFFYDDTRINKHYISSIRPNILKQHFEKHPYLKEAPILYHDCDIIFKNPINWDQFIDGPDWYGSDCRWYIGHDYIASKGGEELDLMCEIVGIDKELIKKNELNSIGAQYLMKNIDYEFWDKVERDCDKMFFEVTELIKQKKAKDPSYHELQIWCSDMWAVLWNGWLRGVRTICHPDLEFSWAVSPIEDYHKYNIMHNAGVTSSLNGHFYKAEYTDKLPYNINLEINENTASFMYWLEIQETAKKSILI